MYPFITNTLGNISENMTMLFSPQYHLIKNGSQLFPKSSSYYFLNITPITDNIYLSGIHGAMDINQINKYNIVNIIHCTKNIPNYFENMGVVYTRISIDDTTSQHIENYFDETFNIIENSVNNNMNILVHCHGGVSRSATILIAYFMRKNNWSYTISYDFIKSKRPIINPNSEFTIALQNYKVI